MVGCESMGEFLSALIDGELPEERAAEVESVDDAIARKASGGSRPDHYIPVRPVREEP